MAFEKKDLVVLEDYSADDEFVDWVGVPELAATHA